MGTSKIYRQLEDLGNWIDEKNVIFPTMSSPLVSTRYVFEQLIKTSEKEGEPALPEKVLTTMRILKKLGYNADALIGFLTICQANLELLGEPGIQYIKNVARICEESKDKKDFESRYGVYNKDFTAIMRKEGAEELIERRLRASLI